MKKIITTGAIAVIVLAMIATLGLGVYGMATGHYILNTSGLGQHRGWSDTDSPAQGRGQGWRWAERESTWLGGEQPADSDQDAGLRPNP